MIIDVIRKTSVIRSVFIGASLVISASLCWSYLQAADIQAEVNAVLSIKADPEYGQYLAGECLTCHSAASSDESIPGIDGRDAAYIVSALIEYKNKTRESETMQSVAGALGNDEMAALAAYFSGLSK